MLRATGTLAAAASLALIGLAADPAAGMAAASAASAHASSAGTLSGAAGPRHTAGPPVPLSDEHPLSQPAATNLPAGVSRACPVPTKVGELECMALTRTNTRHSKGVSPSVIPAGYSPASLQSAYNLTTAAGTNGVGETVAIVDAYSDPDIAADLTTYRTQFGLPLCAPPTTNEGCLSVVNQQGQSSPLPSPNASWATEEADDVDMVSAICPNCNILLVEANSNGYGDLGTAENTAISLGANFVSNSWSGTEFGDESYYDNLYFNHPGKALVFSAGDTGYGTAWPASSQYVTAVGGTTLNPVSGGRGWQETAWAGNGSGCSTADAKPPWQSGDDTSPDGCLNRTENDVAAVADPDTGVAVYDSYQSGGWAEGGGTSVSTPIIAAVYALAGAPAAGTYPASYLYQPGSPAFLNDVTVGSNGGCETYRPYLCTATTGYDGPTGVGTPNGTGAFSYTAGPANLITLNNPGTIDLATSQSVSVQVSGADSGTGQTLSYTATGLPKGVTISTSGVISGKPTAAGTNPVTVTGTDSTGAAGSVTFTIYVMKPLTTNYHSVAGPTHLDLGNMCMDDTQNKTVNGNKIQIFKCNGLASQNWTYKPDGQPGAAGTVTIHNKCLDILNRGQKNGSVLDLWTCNATPSGWNQQWLMIGAGELYNPTAGKCVTDPNATTKNGTQLTIFTCSGNHFDQAWILPTSPIQSGVPDMCVNDAGNGTKDGTKIQIYQCNGSAAQKLTLEPDNTIRINGKCLDVTNRSTLDGAALQLYDCNTNPNLNSNQLWSLGPQGELINSHSGKCLNDPGNSTVNNTTLVQEDCYGQAGEIWAVT